MRQAIGIAVFFRMLGVTAFGLVLTPVFYVVIRRLVEARENKKVLWIRSYLPPHRWERKPCELVSKYSCSWRPFSCRLRGWAALQSAATAAAQFHAADPKLLSEAPLMHAVESI